MKTPERAEGGTGGTASRAGTASSAVDVLWAKTGVSAAGDPTEHPLLCHLVDAAQVARLMWDRVLSPAARRGVAERLGLDEEASGRWLSLLVGLHDLGKASPAFQLQREQTRQRLSSFGWQLPAVVVRVPHGTITALGLKNTLRAMLAVPAEASLQAATAVGGHHGLFPTRLAFADPLAVGLDQWQDIRTSLVVLLADLIGVRNDGAPRSVDTVMGVMLAGLASVADWIASNTDYFPHARNQATPPFPVDLVRYGEEAAVRAEQALGALGWFASASPSAERLFEEAFPHLLPRPLQLAMAELARQLRSPGLVVIEAPMGEGKTEAALYLAERWNAAIGQHGLYVALPTQATSDQMFGRVRDFLSHEYPGSLINLQLLHGHASLSAELEVLRRQGDRLLSLQGVDIGEDAEDGAVIAAEWFTFRKRGLLAPYGVGTIDQALLAVLQARHVFVRQFALAHKAVILDEVHAYDTYMTTLLERLLEWLAALRAPVVLLSATLPADRRRGLMAAYQRGLGIRESDRTQTDTVYPRVSWVTARTSGSLHAPASADRAMVVQVNWVDLDRPDRSTALATLGDQLESVSVQGGCVGIVCNTVRRAQEMYRLLAPRFPGIADDGEPTIDLLHARFPAGEREARQTRALRRFGRPQIGTRRPTLAVLVATQVVEQSLDLDFDLLVSDFAPVDLILQRLGRLHRHARQRPSRVASPALWLGRVPVGADSCPVFDAGIDAVYDPHVLLRSWVAVHAQTEIALPGDIDRLVQEVYSEKGPELETVGESLSQLWDRTRRAWQSSRGLATQEARLRWVKPPWSELPLAMFLPSLGEEDAPDIHPAHQALTRLAEPSVGAVLLYGSVRGLALDAEGRELLDASHTPSALEAVHLLQNAVTVTDRRLVHVLRGIPVPPGWQRSPLLRHHRIIPLSPDGTARFGRHSLTLHPALGVVIETEDS